MKYSRVLVMLGLVGAVALGAALLVRASRPATRPVPAAVTTRRLRPQLHRFLAPPLLHQGTCFVQGGSCSETPCVYFVQGGNPTPMLVSGGLGQVLRVRPPQLPGSGCLGGRRATPQVLRVSAPSVHAAPR